MNKIKSVIFAAGILLALAFTLSCSSDDDDGGGRKGGSGSGSGAGISSSIPLTANKWTNGNVSESQQIWYSFKVSAGKTYYVWWNLGRESLGTIDEPYGDGTKTGRILVMAIYSSLSGENAFLPTSSPAWETPQSFTATSSGTVYIVVMAVLPGTFAVAYTTTNTRPSN